MSGVRGLPVLAVAAVLSSLVGTPLVAQQEGQGGPPQGPPPEAELVFEREVFQYPTFERRDPFRSLVGQNAGPRFESMRLQGIIYSAGEPAQSMALLAAGTGEQIQTQRLRTGQSWGNLRILEIRTNEILVEVEEFGLTEQRIMVLPTRRQGGS